MNANLPLSMAPSLMPMIPANSIVHRILNPNQYRITEPTSPEAMACAAALIARLTTPQVPRTAN